MMCNILLMSRVYEYALSTAVMIFTLGVGDALYCKARQWNGTKLIEENIEIFKTQFREKLYDGTHFIKNILVPVNLKEIC